jgi:hypothetical protein
MMPYGVAAMIAAENARETANNYLKNEGFIAVHPREGVFLGVHKKEAVFLPVNELAPDQPVPVFWKVDDVTSTSTGDCRILECDIHKVPVSDRDKEVTAASAAFNLRTGEVIHVPGRAMVNAEGNTPLNRIFMKMARGLTFLAERRYISPPSYSQP